MSDPTETNCTCLGLSAKERCPWCLLREARETNRRLNRVNQKLNRRQNRWESSQYTVRRLINWCWGNRDRFRREMAELRASNDWQPIATAPRDGTAVLCAYTDKEPVMLVLSHNGVEWVGDDGKSYFDPDYWRPLPPPPTS